MDNRIFIDTLAGSLGVGGHEVEVLLEAMASVLKEEAAEINSVAIPSFGTFEAVKQDEHIVKDLSTGQRLLMPPSITLKFNAATALKKRVLR